MVLSFAFRPLQMSQNVNMTTVLRISHWNVNGLTSKAFGSKLEDQAFLNQILHSDLLLITETHARVPHSISLPGYCTLQINRHQKNLEARRGSGGIAVLVRNQWKKGVSFLHSSCNEMAWVRLNKSYFGHHSDIYLGVVYNSPLDSTYRGNENFEVWDALEKEIAEFSRVGQVTLMGDFNTRIGHRTDFIQNDENQFGNLPNQYLSDDDLDIVKLYRKTCDPKVYPKPDVDRLISLCIASGLKVLNGRILGDTKGKLTCHKWNGSSTVDLGLAHFSLFKNIQYSLVHDFFEHVSDHCMISMGLAINFQKRPGLAREEVGTRIPYPIKWDAETAIHFTESFKSLMNIEKMNITKSIMCEKVMTQESVEKQVQSVNEILLSAVEMSPEANSASRKPSRRKTSVNKPKGATVKKKKWYDQSCSDLRKVLRSYGNLLIKNPSNSYIRGRFFVTKKQYRLLVKKKKAEFKKDLVNRLEFMSERNPKAYWKLVEELRSEGNGASKDRRDTQVANEEWVEHYKALLSEPPPTPPIDMLKEFEDMKAQPFFSELDFKITVEEVRNAVSSLKNGKAAGPDRIKNEMLKASIPYMEEIYTQLFNNILLSGIYPSQWSMGFISNIFKDGDPTDPNNYRGITVNSSLAKVFSSVVNERLDKYLGDKKVMNHFQIGFTKKARTSDHIFVIRTLFEKYVKKYRKPLYAAFVDFRKAYDSVWHFGLLYKLLKCNVRGKVFTIIENMYKQSQVNVKTSDQILEPITVTTGVKQGEILSPRLFNLFINDLPGCIPIDNDTPYLEDSDIRCLLYADDLVLFSLSANGLQKSLDCLSDYCSKWNLKVNIRKTKVMKFSGNGHKCKESFYFNGNQLENTQRYRYLGVELSASGSFIYSIKNLVRRAEKALFKLKASVGNDINPKLGMKLFDQLIKPILTYGSEVWGIDFPRKKSLFDFLCNSQTEVMNLSYCKYILRVNRRSSNFAVRGELGRLPLGIDIISNAFSFLQHAEETTSPILRNALKASKELAKGQGTSWYSALDRVRNLLHLNVNQLVSRDLAKKSLTDLFMKEWKKERDEIDEMSSKLSVYKMVKEHFNYEPYLDQVKDIRYRSSLTKMRISNHTLQVERGRYKKPPIPRDSRLCNLCSVVEDECHFLLKCPKYKEERTVLLENVRTKFPSVSSLDDNGLCLFLLTSEGDTCIEVARFCFKNMPVTGMSKLQ